MKFFLSLIILGIFNLNALSQNNTTDSIIQKLKTQKDDTLKVLSLNELAWTLKYSEPKQASKFLEQSITLAKKLKFNSGLANSFKIRGILDDEAGNIPSSIKNYQTAIFYCKKDNDIMGIAKNEANIGILYRNMNRYIEAIEKFKYSNKVFAKFSFPQGEMVACQNISICYTYLKQLDSALVYIKKAEVKMYELGIEDSNLYGNYGNIFLSGKNYPKAIEYYEKAITLCDDNDNNKPSWIDNLGVAYYDTKRYDKALPLFKKSIELRQNTYSKYSMATYLNLAGVYTKTKDFENACKSLVVYNKIRDSLFSLENSKQLSELTKKYDTERKKNQILSLQVRQKAQQRVIKSEQTQKYFYAGSMILFIALGFLLFKSVRSKSKANKIISDQKEIVQLQKNSLEHKNNEIVSSITYAKRLQNAILPTNENWFNQFPKSFIFYQPKDIVAGDFYWLEEKNNMIYFASADCTGHGVPGAMVSLVCSSALNRSLMEFDINDTGKILDKTRELVIETFQKNSEDVMDGMDISLCGLNKDTLELFWSGANSPIWYILPNSDEIVEIKGNKQPIGKYYDIKPFTTHTIQLERGTRIYLFSDGYPDQFGGELGKKFKYQTLKNLFLSLSAETMQSQGVKTEETFTNYKGDLDQIDDVCVIGIEL